MSYDLEIYIGGGLVMSVITFSEADAFLKFILTAVVVGYTLNKWFIMVNDRKNSNKNNNNDNNNKDNEQQD